jgi:hypothetical protein
VINFGILKKIMMIANNLMNSYLIMFQKIIEKTLSISVMIELLKLKVLGMKVNELGYSEMMKTLL